MFGCSPYGRTASEAANDLVDFDETPTDKAWAALREFLAAVSPSDTHLAHAVRLAREALGQEPPK